MPFEKDVTREIYHLRDWVFEYPDLSTIDGRPGLTVLARRLANAVVASVLAGFLWTLLRHLNGYLAWLLPAVAVGVVVFVLVFAASVLWQRIHIAREDNAFVVRQVLLLPRLHSVPLSALQGIDVFEQELRSSLGIGGRRLGCGWRVLVRCQDHWVEFWCDHGRDEDMLRPFPPRVAEFVEQLHRITGLPCPEQPIASHAQQQGAHRVGQTIVVPLASETHRQIYKSLDEMPPGLRHVAEEQIARTRTTGERQQFTITDTHTYRTLDEMPPELRHVAEQQIARAGANRNRRWSSNSRSPSPTAKATFKPIIRSTRCRPTCAALPRNRLRRRARRL